MSPASGEPGMAPTKVEQTEEQSQPLPQSRRVTAQDPDRNNKTHNRDDTASQKTWSTAGSTNALSEDSSDSSGTNEAKTRQHQDHDQYHQEKGRVQQNNNNNNRVRFVDRTGSVIHNGDDDGRCVAMANASFLEDPEVQSGRCNPDPFGEDFRQPASTHGLHKKANGEEPQPDQRSRHPTSRRDQGQHHNRGAAVVVPKVVRVSPFPPSSSPSLPSSSRGINRGDRYGNNTNNSGLIRPKPIKHQTPTKTGTNPDLPSPDTAASVDKAALSSAALSLPPPPGMTQETDTQRLLHLDDRRRKSEEKVEAKRRKDAQVDFHSTPASHRQPSRMMNSVQAGIDPNGGHPHPHPHHPQHPQHSVQMTQGTTQQLGNPHHHHHPSHHHHHHPSHHHVNGNGAGAVPPGGYTNGHQLPQHQPKQVHNAHPHQHNQVHAHPHTHQPQQSQQPQLHHPQPQLQPHPAVGHHHPAVIQNSGTSIAPSLTSSKGKKPQSSVGGSLSNGTNNNSDGSMPGANGVLHGGLYAGGVAAPRHQRLMSESVVEVKSLQRLAAEQGREIAELRKSHDDLELRLEVQSNRCMDLERTLEDQEREWAEQAQELEEERDGWKTRFEKEEEKNQHLRMQMGRKDQDIQRMLQRKYDKRDSRGKPMRQPDRKLAVQLAASSLNGEPKAMKFRSPREIMASSGTPTDIRERNVSTSLEDFFGM